MKSLKILQILPALGQGGVEQGTIDLSKYFAFIGVTSFVASNEGFRLGELKETGAVHICMPLNSKNPFIQFINYIKLRKLIRQHEINLVHVRSRAPAWSAYFAAKHEKIRTVSTFHGTYNFSNSFKKFYNSIMMRTDRVIAGSKFIRQHILSNYGSYVYNTDRVKLIYRGIDETYYHPTQVDPNLMKKIKTEWGVEVGRFTILFPGRLTRWKGQTVFLQALSKLKEVEVKFQAIILGSAQGRLDYLEELEKSVDKYGLRKNVKFIEHCSHMREAYALSDVIVHASTDPEAFGRTIAEAQAMGKPVVCSDRGAPQEVILPGITGMLHMAGNAQDLADKILYILSLDEKARQTLAFQARGRVLENFTSRHMCEQTVQVYKDLLNPPLLSQKNKILIIKHGALGDMFIAMGAFKAIRDHHPQAHIVLMTTSPFAILAEDTPYFDEIWLDERSSVYNIFALLSLRKKILDMHFDRVYDLQNSPRTSLYFRLLGKKNQPQWCGIAPGCSMRQTRADREVIHAYPRFEDQLGLAGITSVPRPDLSWAKANVSRFNLPEKYALLVPGSSPARPMKRWPAAKYAELAEFLLEKRITPLIIGGLDETEIVTKIKALSSHTRDLSGQTSLYDIIELARGAQVTVGNDTGPLHIAALTGCPTVVAWSSHSDPNVYAPQGDHVQVVYESDLENLSLEPVCQAVVKVI